MDKKQQAQFLLKCKKSFFFFAENFCKVKHPNAGIIPFKMFKYQKRSIKAFRKKDRVIYRKCRQSGISTLTGAYALWIAMFYPNRKVLIVSKRDEDAIGYLERNVKFVYEHLPTWMHKIFGDPRGSGSREFEPPKSYNEHTIGFFHGSEIKSLTSSKDTLRSNSASLVIIDEAAFIPDMEAMWTAGQPTLMHGGKVIVISTTNGRGNWYANTWDDAVANQNNFYPIEIPWWEMDWALEWTDDLTGRNVRLAPTDGIEKCVEKEDKIRYGPYKSPWLVQQYRELQEKQEAWKFRQEILMEFIGAGNTVLGRSALLKIENDIDDSYKVRTKPVNYNNSVAGITEYLDMQDNLWIWDLPIRTEKDVVVDGRIIRPGRDGHRYSLGADIATGEASDWSAICIVDVTELKQVAELKIKCETSDFTKMIDYLGRLYNNALAVVESTGLGKTVCQDLKSKYYYPNLYYRRMPSGKKDKSPGFPTSGASKAHIVRAITDNMGAEDGGVLFKSSRLVREANSFIHLGSGKVGNERGSYNNDDLMIASGLACVGIMDALQTPDGLVPTNSKSVPHTQHNDDLKMTMDEVLEKGGHKLMYPVLSGQTETDVMTKEQELDQFVRQIGGITSDQALKRPSSVPKKYDLNYRKN